MLWKKRRTLNRKVPSNPQRKLGLIKIGVVLGALVALLVLIGALGVSEHQSVQSVNSVSPIVEPEQPVIEKQVSTNEEVITNGIVSNPEIKQDAPASGSSEVAPSTTNVIANNVPIDTTIYTKKD